MDEYSSSKSSFVSTVMETSDGDSIEKPSVSVSEEMTVVHNETTCKKFEIDSSAIPSVPTNEQAEELQALGLNVYDQTVLEEGILQQVDRAVQQQESRRQQEMTQKSLESVVDDIRYSIYVEIGMVTFLYIYIYTYIYKLMDPYLMIWLTDIVDR